MIAQTIQLALAPVFALVAIGNILNLLSTRLGRVVDRSRALQDRYANTVGIEHDIVVREIRLIDRRIKLIGRAVLFLVLAGLSIGLTVALLFIQGVTHVALQHFAAASFTLAITLLMGGLVLFLIETRAASAALQIPEEYLERDRSI
ncbi:DUF2721 domain-containing protein [Altererythrobacter sp. FM1]|uniref:DUF2721 domain-containing protein n=1 Tax=Tsuneonella flava TaxID=2055955 RepID=A0ABX7KF23_9SPHN|nr:DUF2721 domain-containing protein [Tsuneonella flava]QSB45385.1 DUF2721 domain-containing protein [Tsuneonella flava]ROT97080.1 DUF2721 domain-containing protein [Altererythrobacter sp. FM1]